MTIINFVFRRETTHLKVNPSGELEEVSWSPNIQMVVLDTTNGEDMQKYAIAYDEFNKFIDSFPERVSDRKFYSRLSLIGTPGDSRNMFVLS